MKSISALRVAVMFCATVAGVGIAGLSNVADAQNLVPLPVSVERGEGVVTLAAPSTVQAKSSSLWPLARYLSGWLPAGRVTLALDAEIGLPVEGYKLEVTADGISIRGTDYGGVWNGIQTLLQLFPAEIYAGDGVGSEGVGDAVVGLPDIVTLPEVTIEDYPRMEYRGVMLDVARTFVPKEQVMRLIDNISRHKINKFHWHLADDEGWRVEIKSLPRLTSVGGFRGGEEPLFAVYGKWDRRYGGFYTQDEIREVVAYAAVRNVEVIPEIDLPGHSRAAAKAYPELLCGYTPSLEASAGYDTRNVWCVAREENYALLDSIIGELAALFPSQYIHLGGDEVIKGQWSRCPDCKALMAALGLGDAARLEDVFMSRAIEIAARHGKKAMVWNEAAESGTLPKTTTVWGWEDPAAARRSAAAGYPTVVCAGSYFYFDQSQSSGDIGHIWAGIVSLEKVYSFDLARAGFTAAEAANVRGVEATFFSELLLENESFTTELAERDFAFLDYQLFPRVCALAEVAWTPAEKRSWGDFEQRLGTSAAPGPETHLARLAAMGVAYRKAAPQAGPATKTLNVKPTTSITSRRAPREGDWYLWRFEKPLTCREIFIRTGYGHLQRAGFPKGRVEISYDGTAFEKVGELHDLKAAVSPEQSVKAVRIVSESNGNGESFTLVEPLKIVQ